MPGSSSRTPAQALRKRLWRWYNTLAKRLLPGPFRLLQWLGWNYRFVSFETKSMVCMLDIADGKAAYTAEDDLLVQRFNALRKVGHYGFGTTSRVGREFLRRHRELLGGG